MIHALMPSMRNEFTSSPQISRIDSITKLVIAHFRN